MKAVLPALLLGVAACAAPATSGQDGDLPTIVSLNPCADAILAEVAQPQQILALSHYSSREGASSMDIAVARRFDSTAGTAEEVLALAPDIVIGDIFMSPSTKAALERAGVEVVQVGITGTLEDSDAQVRQVAEAAGAKARGEALVARIHAAWEAAAAEGEPVTALLWQDGGIVPGETSLATQLLEQAGFASHSAARGLGQGAYLPLEQVLADPPQVILAAGDERMLTHPVLRRMSDAHYASFDPGLLYCGGPTIPRALARLVEIRETIR